MTPLLPQILQRINQACTQATPGSGVVYACERARDGIAEVAARRLRIENRLRQMQAFATRGRGISREVLDQHIESIIEDLRKL